jgi:hypothetical protein
MAITPLPLTTGIGWLTWQLSWLIAWQLWWMFNVSNTWLRWTLALFGPKTMSAWRSVHAAVYIFSPSVHFFGSCVACSCNVISLLVMVRWFLENENDLQLHQLRNCCLKAFPSCHLGLLGIGLVPGNTLCYQTPMLALTTLYQAYTYENSCVASLQDARPTPATRGRRSSLKVY